MLKLDSKERPTAAGSIAASVEPVARCAARDSAVSLSTGAVGAACRPRLPRARARAAASRRVGVRLLVRLAVPAGVGLGREVGQERRVPADLERSSLHGLPRFCAARELLAVAAGGLVLNPPIASSSSADGGASAPAPAASSASSIIFAIAMNACRVGGTNSAVRAQRGRRTRARPPRPPRAPRRRGRLGHRAGLGRRAPGDARRRRRMPSSVDGRDAGRMRIMARTRTTTKGLWRSTTATTTRAQAPATCCDAAAAARAAADPPSAGPRRRRAPPRRRRALRQRDRAVLTPAWRDPSDERARRASACVAARVGARPAPPSPTSKLRRRRPSLLIPASPPHPRELALTARARAPARPRSPIHLLCQSRGSLRREADGRPSPRVRWRRTRVGARVLHGLATAAEWSPSRHPHRNHALAHGDDARTRSRSCTTGTRSAARGRTADGDAREAPLRAVGVQHSRGGCTHRAASRTVRRVCARVLVVDEHARGLLARCGLSRPTGR